jgi:hypothetical protein
MPAGVHCLPRDLAAGKAGAEDVESLLGCFHGGMIANFLVFRQSATVASSRPS